METQVLEGTFLEVQRRLSALPLRPEARLRVVVIEPETPPVDEATLFSDAPRRNGLILVPTKAASTPVTVELVNALSHD